MSPGLRDYEYQFGDNGLLLNSSDAGHAALLPFIDVLKVDGLDSAPLRVTSRDHEGADGGYVDSEYMTTRNIVVEGVLYADPSDPETVCDRLKVEYGKSRVAKPFYFKHPSKSLRMCLGKGQGAQYSVDSLRRTGQTDLRLAIACPDPYIYEADAQHVEGRIQGVGTGFGFPLGFPFGFGSYGGDPGSVVLTNQGNHPAYPVITIYGPILAPSLAESQSGKYFSLNLSLGKSDYVVIDMDPRKKSVKLNGIANRRSSVLPDAHWFEIQPGESVITLNGDMGAASGSAVNQGTPVTNDYVIVWDAEAPEFNVGDRCYLYTSTNALKEPTIFTITGKTSAFGFTNITFTPSAATTPQVGDILVAGVPYFAVDLRSTWH